MNTPPGWYPDPGYAGHGPATERWWDGSAWTEYTRDASGAAGPAFGPPMPSYPPGQQGDRTRGRGPRIAALAVAFGVVVAAIAVSIRRDVGARRDVGFRRVVGVRRDQDARVRA
ncbi:DUF2510 domain-containing protein, partial [Streptomyces hygroscopicus]|uniref:DUF2510 domain-containing protein n=1 Tax=Streptomyces hygroscopicus TaxID=1912 RepID=UPI0033EAEA7A